MVNYFSLPLTARRALIPNLWDIVAFSLIFAAFVLVAHEAHVTSLPLAVIDATPVSLDPVNLPEYALRTMMRMFAAIVASLIFTLTYATLAAKSRRAELVLIPILDILQSVPVLGFLSFTMAFFLGLFPGRVLGAEFAAIFAIFTSQAWNMTFSFYQSLRTVPEDLAEAATSFHLSGWQKFWRLEVPFAMPGLVWNTMMSMSGGWFFVVASEAISVGDTTITLPGIGAYVALAIKQQDLRAVGFAVLTMFVVIMIYDQLLFRPIVAWAEKFRFEQTAAQEVPRSWVLDLFRRARLWGAVSRPFASIVRFIAGLRLALPRRLSNVLSFTAGPRAARALDRAWLVLALAAAGYALWEITTFVRASLAWPDVTHAVLLGAVTLLRVVVLMVLATVIWVPIGVWVGLRPRVAQKVQPLAQFLAAFPVNLVFPVVVVFIVRYQLNPSIWLSPLMVLGTQWYILFNVIAGASTFPSDLKEAAANFHLKGWQWWVKVMLPGVFPYYITGAITASGGSWNASIVAEVASWGDLKLAAIGIGAYIAEATDAGDYPRIVLGIAVMSVYVVMFNRVLWRPLYGFAERRLRLS
jgi:NitT/TauT family transport system permease protein